jgi:hypothetical protein
MVLALQGEVLRIKVMNTDVAVLSATCEASSVPGVRKRMQRMSESRFPERLKAFCNNRARILYSIHRAKTHAMLQVSQYVGKQGKCPSQELERFCTNLRLSDHVDVRIQAQHTSKRAYRGIFS